MTSKTTASDLHIPTLHPTEPAALPFAPTSVVRAFLLAREQGNLLVYNTPKLANDVEDLRASGGVRLHFLNHWHEASLGLAPPALGEQLMYHEADAPAIAEHGGQGLTFSERHLIDDDFEVIPTPGHTPGATAFLWTTGENRLLFTGDTIYLHNGKWRVAVLESSDREQYIESLELLRELDFDLLVPWAAGVRDHYLERVTPGERRDRIDALLGWIQRSV
jgi:glyoxylase-like metal-dependent hydrolase (beta-lactamase superfamily II)